MIEIQNADEKSRRRVGRGEGEGEMQVVERIEQPKWKEVREKVFCDF